MKKKRRILHGTVVTLLLAVQAMTASASITKVSGESSWITPFATKADFQNNQTNKPPIFKPYSVDSASNTAALTSLISQHLYNRDTAYTVHYTGNTSTLDNDISAAFSSIFSADDYLSNCMKGYSFNYSGYTNDVTINFTSDYWATKAQEDQVNTKVTQLLSTLITPGMTNAQKEETIHDWIVSHVAYDTSLVQHSAYAGLFGAQETVCQGYALLTYKMLKEAGIHNHIMVGYGHAGGYDPNAKELGEDAHAWNIVQLDNGSWVYLDSTWDDPIPDVPGRIEHTYYNVSEQDIAKVHTWNTLPNLDAAPIDTPYWAGQTKDITITARDRYGNPVSGAQIYMDIKIANSGNAETYTVNGKQYKTSASNLLVGDKTKEDGKTKVTLTFPAIVSSKGDGITIIIKAKQGTNNTADYIGSPFVFQK